MTIVMPAITMRMIDVTPRQSEIPPAIRLAFVFPAQVNGIAISQAIIDMNPAASLYLGE